jgi:polyisoprenyl-teichoic acid--peptidoglycan teichoic acid transferase
MNQPYMPEPEQYLSSLEPITRPKRRLLPPGWKKASLALLAIIFIGGLGYMAYIVNIVAGASSRAYSLTPLLTDGDHHTNVLILGVGNPGHAGEKLSDTIMVMSVNSQTQRIVYVSIPRDLRVRLDGYGTAKINQANAVGGADLARQSVEDVLGIPVHYTVTTNFNGLKDLVDAVGGIDVDVKQALRDPEYPCLDDEKRSCGLTISMGPQHMDGSLALGYARCRKGNCGNDFGRAARQQEVIDLIAQKVGKPNMIFRPAEISRIAEAIRANMITDMSGLDMLQVLRHVRHAKATEERFVLSTDSNGLLTSVGSSDLVPIGGDYDRIHARIAELLE